VWYRPANEAEGDASRTGSETFMHEGAYASDALLEQDIRRNALGA